MPGMSGSEAAFLAGSHMGFDPQAAAAVTLHFPEPPPNVEEREASENEGFHMSLELRCVLGCLRKSSCKQSVQEVLRNSMPSSVSTRQTPAVPYRASRLLQSLGGARFCKMDQNGSKWIKLVTLKGLLLNLYRKRLGL